MAHLKKVTILLTLFFLASCQFGLVGAEDLTEAETVYYVIDGIYISPGPLEQVSDDSLPPIHETNNWKVITDQLRYFVIDIFNENIGFPPQIFTEFLAIIFILVSGGALTLLVTRWKVPEDPDSRTMILYNTIKEHPGATLSELQELTGYSRGSVSANLHRLDMNAKIQKSVRNGTARYYIASIPEDEINGFLRKVAAREKPQKIFEAIISTPGISQKELHETTGIPKTTLQWHLAQLAKYEVIKSMRDRNTVHYSVIPDYILLYNHILEEGKQNRKAADGQDPTNSREL
ncbi:MAG TPA: winged helix-turn-helix transcriptional regulator [Methanocorpusculum sp.]|nr:winged helix-turn-helix transcriptional regulator [Methanocorpusculum sp.]